MLKLKLKMSLKALILADELHSCIDREKATGN